MVGVWVDSGVGEIVDVNVSEGEAVGAGGPVVVLCGFGVRDLVGVFVWPVTVTVLIAPVVTGVRGAEPVAFAPGIIRKG